MAKKTKTPPCQHLDESLLGAQPVASGELVLTYLCSRCGHVRQALADRDDVDPLDVDERMVTR